MLRKLEIKDAPYMYEWMKDEKVLKGLSNKFQTLTIQDCIEFIEKSQDDQSDVHRAIVNSNDEYMGTISLKHMDADRKTAELAIVLRTEASGGGYGRCAMRDIIAAGVHEFGLEEIYWQVLRTNDHAIGFYNHLNYKRVSSIPEHITKPYGGIHPELYYWYCATDEGENESINCYTNIL